MTTQHTPTPFEAVLDKMWGPSVLSAATAPDSLHGGTKRIYVAFKLHSMADARFIAQACNSYDALLAAAEAALADIESGFIANPSKAGERCLNKHETALRAAIKLAKDSAV